MSTTGNDPTSDHRDTTEESDPWPARAATGPRVGDVHSETQTDQPPATREPTPSTDSELRAASARRDPQDAVRDLPPDSADAIYRSQVSDPNDPGQRAAARGALINAVRSTAGQMRRTAGRLDKLADRLSAVAVAQMETSQAEREFAAADHRARTRGPVRR